MNLGPSNSDKSPKKEIKLALEERWAEEEKMNEMNHTEPEIVEEMPSAETDGEPSDGERSEEIEEMEAIIKERDDYLNHLQRLQAEFDNFRKRVQRERVEMKELMLQDVFVRLLDVVESMERALHPDNKTDDIESYHQGVDIVYQKLMSVLGEYGLTKLETVGQPFDPNLHEAIGQVSCEDCEPGTIVNELSPGYSLKDRVLKAPKVQIAAAASQKTE